MRQLSLRCAVIALLVFACRSRDEAPPTDTGAMMMDSSMKGMPGMHGDTTMAGMMAHMQSMMDTASLATMQAMMPAHPQMLDSMLASMKGDMRRMNMAPGAEWTALEDSLRKDLERLSTTPASELVAVMREHHGRMMRLMQMHRSMMRRPPA